MHLSLTFPLVWLGWRIARVFTRLKNRKMVTEKYLARHFLSIQQFLEEGELENVYWIPGVENPADGLTKLRSEMGPITTL